VHIAADIAGSLLILTGGISAALQLRHSSLRQAIRQPAAPFRAYVNNVACGVSIIVSAWLPNSPVAWTLIALTATSVAADGSLRVHALVRRTRTI